MGQLMNADVYHRSPFCLSAGDLDLLNLATTHAQAHDGWFGPQRNIYYWLVSPQKDPKMH